MMMPRLSYALGGLLVLGSLTAATASTAGDSVPLQKGYTTLKISSVKWAVKAGAGTFSVIVTHDGTNKTAVQGWVSATSEGATTLQANLAPLIPNQSQTLHLGATANGRC